jgi:hypothetical protein
VCEPHLDLLALVPRPLEAFGISKRPGKLMDVARDLARRFFWAALRFEWTYIAVELAGAIQKCLALVYGAARSKPLSARAVVDVAGRIISKVAAREGAIISLRFVEHGDMWCDALLLDKPVQHRSRTVSGIGGKSLRLEAEALFGSVDHGLCSADLGLTNGAGCLDINDHPKLDVDEIVVRVSEECRSLVRPGPLGCGIGRRNELRYDNESRLAGHLNRLLQHGVIPG